MSASSAPGATKASHLTSQSSFLRSYRKEKLPAPSGLSKFHSIGYSQGKTSLQQERPQELTKGLTKGIIQVRNKLTHRQARFHKGHHGADRCGACRSFIRENQCKKVLGPLDANDCCAVGISSKTGKRYDPVVTRLESGIQST